jgi:fructose-1,6-bisphosphatase/inositol monophosphatase family enzyme
MARQRSVAYDRLEEMTKLQRCAYDAYGYALVATGRADVVIDPVMNAWDCGPLPVILREAGGRFSTWSGEEKIDGGDAVATNGIIHEHVLKILQQQ